MTTLFRLRLAAVFGALLLLFFPSFAVPSPSAVEPLPVVSPADWGGPDAILVPAVLEHDEAPTLPPTLTVDLASPVIDEVVPAAERIDSQC